MGKATSGGEFDNRGVNLVRFGPPCFWSIIEIFRISFKIAQGFSQSQVIRQLKGADVEGCLTHVNFEVTIVITNVTVLQLLVKRFYTEIALALCNQLI